MRQLTIVAEDKVGLLADISYILGRSRINIDSISVGVVGGKAVINLGVKDDQRASHLLAGSGYHVLTGDTLALKCPDQPGVLAEVSKTLADAGVNLESIIQLTAGEGFALVTIKVDKPAKAQKLLAKYLDVES